MGFADLPDRVRFGIVFAAVIGLGLAAGWVVVNSQLPPQALFLIPAAVLVMSGVAWDRIFLHDLPL